MTEDLQDFQRSMKITGYRSLSLLLMDPSRGTKWIDFWAPH